MPSEHGPLAAIRAATQDMRAAVLADLGSGDARRILSRYGLGALAAGAVLGCLIAWANALLALLVVLAAGFGLGYGTRSYVSHRRRVRYWAARGEM